MGVFPVYHHRFFSVAYIYCKYLYSEGASVAQDVLKAG